jgi:flagella basal body P-ring formation protein FlgA
MLGGLLAALMAGACALAGSDSSTVTAYVAVRYLPKGHMLEAGDLEKRVVPAAWLAAAPAAASGLGNRLLRSLSKAEPVLQRDLGPKALFAVGQKVALGWRRGDLTLMSQGLALEARGQGEMASAQVLGSGKKVRGRVGAEGCIWVEGP